MRDYQEITVVTESNSLEFQEQVNDLLGQGWQIISTSSGVINAEQYDYPLYFNAIMGLPFDEILAVQVDANNQEVVFDEVKPCNAIGLRQTNVADLQCSERLKNILKWIMYNEKDKRLFNVFDLYTESQIKKVRGIGKLVFQELEDIRIKAKLTYKS